VILSQIEKSDPTNGIALMVRILRDTKSEEIDHYKQLAINFAQEPKYVVGGWKAEEGKG
jgi:hypothetical protein